MFYSRSELAVFCVNLKFPNCLASFFPTLGLSLAGLCDRPRAENENIHQSFCALLPIWPRRHVGNADQSSEQVEWIEVRADVAAFDRSLH